MKVFLTGATGILGTDIQTQLKDAGHEFIGFGSSDIRIGDLSDVTSRVNDFKPDTIIHCAAMTNVDLCEDDRHAALTTNVIGSQNLSHAASRINAKIVYISSCGVYGNVKESPHNEYDKTIPLNYHHFTKLEGEVKVKEQNDNFLIIRPGWLFGGTRQHRKNFVEARRKEATTAAVLKSAGDKFGSPTYTLHLAKLIMELLASDHTGTFNAVNEGCASRFDYVSEIVRLFHFETKVEAVNSNAFPRKANMPDNECLENLNLSLINKNTMPGWREALADYIHSTY